MGIRGLFQFIKTKVPNSIEKINLESLSGKTLIIDAYIYLYESIAGVRAGNYELKNDFGETTSHILAFLYKTLSLLELNIKPIFIFDGKPPVIKKNLIDKRIEIKEKYAKRAIEDPRLLKYSIKITPNHIELVKKLLNFLGVNFMDAPSEAEAQCAYLVKNGIGFGIISKDSDILLYENVKLFTNFFQEISNKRNEVSFINTNKFLKEINLTREKLIDFAILLGCDYSISPNGIGAVKGLDIINKYSNLDNFFASKDFLKYQKNFNDINLDLDLVNQIRDFFNCPPVIKFNNFPNNLKPNLIKLEDFLKSLKFNSKRVNNIISRINNINFKFNQRSLDMFLI